MEAPMVVEGEDLLTLQGAVIHQEDPVEVVKEEEKEDPDHKQEQTALEEEAVEEKVQEPLEEMELL